MLLKKGALLTLVLFVCFFAFSSTSNKISDRLGPQISIGDTLFVQISGNKCEIRVRCSCGSTCETIMKVETWPPDTLNMLKSMSYTWPPDNLQYGVVTGFSVNRVSK